MRAKSSPALKIARNEPIFPIYTNYGSDFNNKLWLGNTNTNTNTNTNIKTFFFIGNSKYIAVIEKTKIIVMDMVIVSNWLFLNIKIKLISIFLLYERITLVTLIHLLTML